MEHLKIFAKTVEEVAYRQIFGMSESEAYKDCLVRIMPDCHAGTGCNRTAAESREPSGILLDIRTDKIAEHRGPAEQR